MTKREVIRQIIDHWVISSSDPRGDKMLDDVFDALMKPGKGALKSGQIAWMHRDLNDPESEPVRDAYRAILTHIKESRDD